MYVFVYVYTCVYNKNCASGIHYIFKIYSCTETLARINTSVHVHTHTCTHIHTRAHTHAYIIHANTHTHTHTH